MIHVYLENSMFEQELVKKDLIFYPGLRRRKDDCRYLKTVWRQRNYV